MPDPNPLGATPDVLVIGGGTAALCAAIAARRAGVSVRLLEQAPRGLRGGNTRHSRNLRFMHVKTTPLSTGPYPETEFWADLERATAGTIDAILTPLLIQGSEDITDWLEGAGVHFQSHASGVLPPSRKTAFLLGGGKSMLNALYTTAERLGVVLNYATEVQDLSIRDGRLEQVTISSGGHVHTLSPRAVIACCGGAQASRDWLRTHWGDAAEGFINRGTPYAEGKVLRSMLAQGAVSVGDPEHAYLVAVDARSPDDDGGIATRVRCMPAGIVVDVRGRRAYDEGGDTASTRYALWGQRLARFPGQIGHLILDARGVRAAPPSLYPPLSAASVTALAEVMGIDPVALAATVADYNAAVRASDDPGDTAAWHSVGLDPPKSGHALPLTEPPFAAYPMRPGITFTYHGVGIDAQTRVRLTKGGAMENLFAAGMIMAPNIIPRGYVSGLALTIGIVFGRLAGQEAARHAQR
ncbi:FAD-dependent tricarballylate dehydrogenase TcuA [Thiorhodococcus mannitoliphagus]|uniref:FAD-dependent tricarballylate dehydrogenase TcuA n=1 Tax=Thiorhodococcus mannitoliphagus TaxID=329406 RepID=A0A6P1DTF0_9GAMM|nr:FAD-dependent tricarballylate dehydrogenase TcuA [Thiorhodococcus mannitoliphagus]NEX19966.1 FAD-dependent tricarballylate dehydrogenase TcuA [Thiorhodococcus mannitoliphagus]